MLQSTLSPRMSTTWTSHSSPCHHHSLCTVHPLAWYIRRLLWCCFDFLSIFSPWVGWGAQLQLAFKQTGVKDYRGLALSLFCKLFFVTAWLIYTLERKPYTFGRDPLFCVFVTFFFVVSFTCTDFACYILRLIHFSYTPFLYINYEKILLSEICSTCKSLPSLSIIPVLMILVMVFGFYKGCVFELLSLFLYYLCLVPF